MVMASTPSAMRMPAAVAQLRSSSSDGFWDRVSMVPPAASAVCRAVLTCTDVSGCFLC
jgi:hypothetical protein